MSDLVQRLLAGETRYVALDVNPGNYDQTLKAYGFRLRTQLAPNKRKRILWAEPLEPARKARKRTT